MYVDDAHFGADSISEAVDFSKEFTKLLMSGGFRKWGANNPDLLKHIDPDWLDKPEDSVVSCLGMKWNVDTDEIFYVNVYSDLMSSLTKRSVLSQIAKFYDPLGLLSPVTKAKSSCSFCGRKN